MGNKDLWDRVKVTDPRAVKPITGKPYKGNSPKPYWLIERATDVFGPIGTGWGVTVKSERFERVSDTDTLHVCVVSVWYVLDGKRSETFDQMGGTKAAYMSKNGPIVDEDAGKKSVTDGMVKCLSMLGFAGDIFSGLWDDSKYVQWADEEWGRRSEHTQPAKASGVIKGTDGMMETLSPELKQVIYELSEEIKAGFDTEGVERTFDYIEAQNMDNDTKVALWSLLPSNIRSALKKEGDKRRLKDGPKMAAVVAGAQ